MKKYICVAAVVMLSACAKPKTEEEEFLEMVAKFYTCEYNCSLKEEFKHLGDKAKSSPAH